MESAPHGTTISTVEVIDIAPRGVWLLVDGEEYFLAYTEFPWFKAAPVSAVFHVERPGPDHLFWPDLDVDLHVQSLREPASFPLVARTGA